MGTKNSPGEYDCYENAKPDEPLFVLLGRDVRAPILVEMWAAMSELKGTDPKKIAEARQCAEQMRAWRETACVCAENPREATVHRQGCPWNNPQLKSSGSSVADAMREVVAAVRELKTYPTERLVGAMVVLDAAEKEASRR